MQKPKKPPSRVKAQVEDDSIMGTNNSSIVSKRSVERLYFPNEPHFFRYFVKKPQRRAPLINRGYWLRMKAIDFAVQKFLEEPSTKPKVVLNLGCGYDPLPWQCLTRYPELCKGVVFIDVDYMDLMLKKREVVLNTSALTDILHNISSDTTHADILFQSDEYQQVGCDMRELSKLSAALNSIIDLQNSLVFCAAEVSITYMNVEAADALISWAAQLPAARFCLIEQLLPKGPLYPFATTMLAHFDKLKTPLRAVKKYPTEFDQTNRFRSAGWKNAAACNLWQLWSSSKFLSTSERATLDRVEAFDEWEEFALFGAHYILLIAESRSDIVSPLAAYIETADGENVLETQPNQISCEIKYTDYADRESFRRFGAPFTIRSSESVDLLANFGGMGVTTRMDSCSTYASTSQVNAFYPSLPEHGPSPRMCHTVTDLGDRGSLLIGGRTSPDNALRDCWLYHKWTNIWERVADLPTPLYRHCALQVSEDSVLVVGGRVDSQNFQPECFIWRRRGGWVRCLSRMESSDLETGEPSNAFHASPSPLVYGGLAAVLNRPSLGVTQGILAGGISTDGVVSDRIWRWTLTTTSQSEDGITQVDEPIIAFYLLHSRKLNLDCFSRFGAATTWHQGQLVVVGGIGRKSLPRHEVYVLKTIEADIFSAIPLHFNLPSPPLHIGVSIYSSGKDLIIVGGGAVCFSFGTAWNKACYTISLDSSISGPSLGTFEPSENTAQTEVNQWEYLGVLSASSDTANSRNLSGPLATQEEPGELLAVRRVNVSSAESFKTIVSSSRPVILQGLDLGPCTNCWTNEYLRERLGPDREVIVHKASTDHMDFVSKNFEYISMTFAHFIEGIERGEKLYLRSLASEKPSQTPAEFERDFPALSLDFHMPPELKYVVDNAHSSPFRISGPINMWLHYDVMSNVLCQIRGTKRLILFPPDDVGRLGFAPGASSSSIDVFSRLRDRKMSGVHPYEAILQPGEVLYLPSLWLHTASPITSTSVSLNVFFRNLDSGYAAGKDVYGNRDLQAYEKGRQDIARIVKSFHNLPRDTQKFYLQRLAQELGQSAITE